MSGTAVSFMLLLHSLRHVLDWALMVSPLLAILGCCLAIAGPGRRGHFMRCLAGAFALVLLASWVADLTLVSDRAAQNAQLAIGFIALHTPPLLAAWVRRQQDAPADLRP